MYNFLKCACAIHEAYGLFYKIWLQLVSFTGTTDFVISQELGKCPYLYSLRMSLANGFVTTQSVSKIQSHNKKLKYNTIHAY